MTIIVPSKSIIAAAQKSKKLKPSHEKVQLIFFISTKLVLYFFLNSELFGLASLSVTLFSNLSIGAVQGLLEKNAPKTKRKSNESTKWNIQDI